jgi:molecular chaperone DnaK (HSP70)
MTEGVQGPSSPQDKVLYKQEFEKAVNLFQKSLSAYDKSQMQQQKDEFKNVMKKALQVIHQTIQQVASREVAQKKQAQLDHDYQSFLKSDSPKNIEQLNKDLNDLK